MAIWCVAICGTSCAAIVVFRKSGFWESHHSIQGACFIFSDKFIQIRDKAFNPNTFMYFEEDILQYECVMQKMRITYSPSIQVIHLGSVSTHFVFQDEKIKGLWFTKHLFDSIGVLLKMMEEKDLKS